MTIRCRLSSTDHACKNKKRSESSPGSDEPILSYTPFCPGHRRSFLPEPGQIRADFHCAVDPGNLVLDPRIKGGFHVARRRPRQPQRRRADGG